MRFSVVALAILSASCACTQKTEPSEVPPPTKLPEGDGLGTPLGDMCENLRSRACPEGFPKTKNGKTRNCYQAMTVAQSNRLSIPIECVTKASTKEAVRACGDPRFEITFRCEP